MSIHLEIEAPLEAGVPGLIRRQLTRPVTLPSDINLKDQVAIISGSNVGLGFSASSKLLSLGLSHLIMGVRNLSKGNTAADKLRSSFPAATISVWPLNMESYESIQEFAKKCDELPRIDMVILNAGMMSSTFTPVPSTKMEVTFQVNYLSTALLSILLLPILKRKRDPKSTRPPVLSLVGSDAAYLSTFTLPPSSTSIFQHLNNPQTYSPSIYNDAKLLLIFFVAKLSSFISPNEVVINVSNPGMTKGTSFFKETPWYIRWVMGCIQAVLARTTEVGAGNYLVAVLGMGGRGEVGESHGGFVSDWRVKAYPKICYGEQGNVISEKLWEETMEELGFAGVKDIVEGLKGAKV